MEGKWFNIWCEDYESLIETQHHNIQSELDTGFSWSGEHVQKEYKILDEFRNRYIDQLDKFKTMTDQQINRWCYFDLLKRGVITR